MMRVEALALTFDDGPDSAQTPLLLDILDRAGATATFFPIAPRATANPGVIRRMLAGGHTIGIHCEVHERHSHHDRSWGQDDVDRALDRLRGLGAGPTLWRTPWGEEAPWTGDVARERDLRLVGWDVDTHDWRGDSAAEMFASTREELSSGAVVLAHDGVGPGARRRDVGETLAYVKLVIEHAHRHNLELRALT
jgi:peptidoglycan/xylan/chitin deacetylase (PgdA/CDA1 family)